MSYQKTTIKAFLAKIDARKVYLPSIQRKYVWTYKGNDDRVCKLFDSILREYPIGTFLFWNMSGKKANEEQYAFYEFIKDYNELTETTFNPRVKNALASEAEYDIVLDGQQRLTSLYISLYGALTLYKGGRGRPRNSANSYDTKELYFNLLSKIKNLDSGENEGESESDVRYEFKFLSPTEAAVATDEAIWYKAKEILQYNRFEDMTPHLISKGWVTDSTIHGNLSALWQAVHKAEVINYFPLSNKPMSEVLDVFVRVNSGGVVLSKTDLLFSTMISHWAEIRDKVDALIKEVNAKGEKFAFNSDFIMRASLYLLDYTMAKLKVEDFKKPNVDKIRKDWGNIESAVKNAIDFLVSAGFCEANIESNLAILPIIYAYYKGLVTKNNRDDLKKYFVSAQLKKVFGTASNSTLTSIREKLKPLKTFSFASLKDIKFTNGATLSFTDTNIDELFQLRKGEKYTFMVLSLLYKGLKFANQCFHQDHVHPQSEFDKLTPSATLTQQKIDDWKCKRDQLANLQLLEGRENESKNDAPLVDWIKVPENKAQAKYIPSKIPLGITNFENFYDNRKSLILTELQNLLK